MKYDFDRPTDRRNSGSIKWDVEPGELPMWVADMDFETAPSIRQALSERVSHGIFGYTDVTDEWYEAYMGWWRRRYGFEIQKDWLIFTTGVVPAISSLVRKLTTPAEKVVVQTPVYNIFFNSIVNNGRRPFESPLALDADGYHMDFGRLEKDLSDPQATLLILCNPQNPCGRIWDKQSLARVAEMCRKYGVTVISDEVHCDLTKPGEKYVPFASVSDTARQISVTCLSPSKSFNVAGLHTAAVVVPDENLRHRVWRSVNTDEVAEPNDFAVNAAVAAYNGGEEWLDSLREYLWKNHERASDFIKKELPQLHVVPQNATYLLWVDARDLNGGLGLASYIREKTGLFLSDGASYGKAGEGFIRINLACQAAVLEDGLSRLKHAVELLGS